MPVEGSFGSQELQGHQMWGQVGTCPPPRGLSGFSLYGLPVRSLLFPLTSRVLSNPITLSFFYGEFSWPH